LLGRRLEEEEFASQPIYGERLARALIGMPLASAAEAESDLQEKTRDSVDW